LSSSASCGITATLYGSALFNPTSNPWPGCVSAKSTVGGGGIIHNATIQRNVVYDCWGEGISTFNANGTTIQDNVIYDNWAQNLFVDNATNVLVQRNIVYNTPNNYVQANSGFTLAEDLAGVPPSPLASNNTVINNFVYNAPFCAFCWTLISGSGLNNVLIANNTIINSNFATGSGGSYNITNTNSTIANNIVSGGTVTVPDATGLTFSHNLWAALPPSAAIGAGDTGGDPKFAATGSTAGGQLSASYFKLLTGSPAIGNGKPLSQVTKDFFGTPRKAAPDIGGYESP
jgi:parallel beta-helix repeat protein